MKSRICGKICEDFKNQQGTFISFLSLSGHQQGNQSPDTGTAQT